MKHMGNRDYRLWDEKDSFFYDVLRYPDGTFHKFRVRSLVGLIPLYAVERLEEEWIKPFPEFYSNLNWFLKNRQDIVQRCVTTIERDGSKVHILAIVDEAQMRHLLERIWTRPNFVLNTVCEVCQNSTKSIRSNSAEAKLVTNPPNRLKC